MSKFERPSSFKSKVEGTFLSDRGVSDYVESLDIQEADLDDPNAVILDLGSGLEQNFAKEMRERSLRAKVVSIDPRFGLRPTEDVALMEMDEHEEVGRQKRAKNRQMPEPLTIAALSGALPFKENSIQQVYALFSVPYYLENKEEIKNTIYEAVRILKPGGSIRAFPVIKEHVDDVQDIVKGIKDVTFTLTLKRKMDEDEDWLLVVNKNQTETK